MLFKMVKEAMMSSAKAKIGALALKSELYELKDRMSADTYGGAPLLAAKARRRRAWFLECKGGEERHPRDRPRRPGERF